MPHPTVALAAFLLAGLSGCAQVKVTHVADGDDSDGVHFYEPRPYLLVGVQTVKDDKGEHTQYTSQIIWLPDHSRRYKVEIKPGWGTVDGSAKLSNGWMLTELGAKSDSKIPETLNAIAGLVTAAVGKALEHSEPGLYRIDIAPDGTVSLVKQAKW